MLFVYKRVFLLTFDGSKEALFHVLALQCLGVSLVHFLHDLDPGFTREGVPETQCTHVIIKTLTITISNRLIVVADAFSRSVV